MITNKIEVEPEIFYMLEGMIAHLGNTLMLLHELVQLPEDTAVASEAFLDIFGDADTLEQKILHAIDVVKYMERLRDGKIGDIRPDIPKTVH